MKALQQVVPFYFGTQGRELFGCFHEPARKGMRRCSILICQPVGHEYINSHRALRQLAARLAEAGFPVLRFDYYGCGDSCGEAVQGSIARWLDDISAAIAAIRARTGFIPVYVVGLRLGATLAAMSGIQQDNLAGLVLWDPVVNGKNYWHELLSLQKEMLRFRPKPGRLLGPIVLRLTGYAERARALVPRAFAYGTQNLRIAVARWRSGMFLLPSERATARAKLVLRVHGPSSVTACPSSLAPAPSPDHQPVGSFRSRDKHSNTEILGFPVSNMLRTELEELDLLKVPKKPAPRILVVHTTQTADENCFKDRLVRTEAQVEHRELQAPEIWLPTKDGSLLVPAQVLQSVVSWICGATS